MPQYMFQGGLMVPNCPFKKGSEVEPPPVEDYLSVVDYGGAYGDGTHNDTTAISNTINEAINQSKYAYMPPGTYLFTSLSFPSGADLRGAGQSNTVMNSSSNVIFRMESGRNNINLEGFKLNGNYSGSGQSGLYLMGSNSAITLTDLDMENFYKMGIYSTGGWTTSTLTRVQISHCGEWGIHIDGGGSYITFDDCHNPRTTWTSGESFPGIIEPPHGFYLKTCNHLTMRDCTGGYTYNSQNNASGIGLNDVTYSDFYDCEGHYASIGIALNNYPEGGLGCDHLNFYHCGGANCTIARHDWGVNTNIYWDAECYGTLVDE